MSKAKSSKQKSSIKNEPHSHVFMLLFLLLVVICAGIFVFHWKSTIYPASAYCTTADCGSGGVNPCANIRDGAGWYCGGDSHGNGAGGSWEEVYECSRYKLLITSNWCGPVGCHYNPSGADRCN